MLKLRKKNDEEIGLEIGGVKMKAEIISTSTPLLQGQDSNKNVAFLTRELTAMGIFVEQVVTVKDDPQYLKQALEAAEIRSEIIFVIGGLGPNEADISKETISEYLDIPLALDNETEDRIISYHQNSDLKMPEDNQLQALILMDSIPLRNITGLAAGFMYTNEKHTYILLPGPFDEFKPMFLENTKPLIIQELLDDLVFKTHNLSLYGLTMAQIQEKLSDLISYKDNPFVGVYFEEEEAEIQITARAKSEDKVESMLEKTTEKVMDRVGDDVFSENGQRLSHVVKELLNEQEKTITAAESLTGGAFMDMISAEPESSKVTEAGIVTYSENIKNGALGVTKKTLDKYGVVSAECAIEMAEKAMKMFEADIAVSLTGVAGPSSHDGEIPGTVWIGVAQEDKETFAKRFHFGYKRIRNRKHSVLSAMNLARLVLLDKPIKDQVFFDDED